MVLWELPHSVGNGSLNRYVSLCVRVAPRCSAPSVIASMLLEGKATAAEVSESLSADCRLGSVCREDDLSTVVDADIGKAVNSTDGAGHQVGGVVAAGTLVGVETIAAVGDHVLDEEVNVEVGPSGNAPPSVAQVERGGTLEVTNTSTNRVYTNAAEAFRTLTQAAKSKADADQRLNATSAKVTVCDAIGVPIAGMREVDIMADVRRVQDLLRTFQERKRVVATGRQKQKVSKTESRAYNARWRPEVARLTAERRALDVPSEEKEVLSASFGLQRVEEVLLESSQAKRVREGTQEKHTRAAVDYLAFCEEHAFKTTFLDGFSDTSAAIVLILFLERQLVWRGATSASWSLAGVRQWFLTCNVDKDKVETWFSDPRVVNKRKETLELITDTDRLARSLENQRDLVSVNFLWMAKSVFWILPGTVLPFPFENGGRLERMKCACFYLMFAYGVRPSNVTYDKPHLLDQLLMESTVFFKMRTPGGQIEVFFSHQFARHRHFSWFVSASVMCICIVHLKGKNWGSDKPNHPEPLVYAIVEGRSPATDILKDMLFQHCLDAMHTRGDAFFSINTLRRTGRTGALKVDNCKLLQRHMAEFVQTLAVLLGEDPSHTTLYATRRTAATQLHAAAAELEGNEYYRSCMHWLSREAPKRYLNPQVRSVNALDVQGLSREELQSAVMPSSKRSLWKNVLQADKVAWSWTLVDAGGEVGGAAVISESSSSTSSSTDNRQDEPRSHVDLSVEVAEEEFLQREREACEEARQFLATVSNQSVTEASWGPPDDVVDMLMDDDDLVTPAIAPIGAQLKSDALTSIHEDSSEGNMDRRGLARARMEISSMLSELAGVFSISPGDRYDNWAQVEKRSPSAAWEQQWTYLTVEASTGLPLVGEAYSVIWVMANGVPEMVLPEVFEEWEKFTEKARASLLSYPGDLGDTCVDDPVDAIIPTAVTNHPTEAFTAEDVGTISEEGLLRAPGGTTLICPTDVPGVSFYAIYYGVYGKTPCVTQSWLYCKALVSGWDASSGKATVSFPPGVCFKDGFLNRGQAWVFASTGRDTRPQEVEASAPARLRLESLGWLVFYGAIRRAVHPVTKQVVGDIVLTDPTVYRVLHSRADTFEGGVFVTFESAQKWLSGDESQRPRPSPFDLRTSEELREWRDAQPSLLANRVGMGYKLEPVPGRPGEFYAGCKDPNQRCLPLFPLQEDVTSSYDGSSVFTDEESRSAYLNAPGTQTAALLGLISSGTLPASGYNEATGSWKIYSVENPEPPPERVGLSPLEWNERVFQDMVRRGVIADERREGCSWPPPASRELAGGAISMPPIKKKRQPATDTLVEDTRADAVTHSSSSSSVVTTAETGPAISARQSKRSRR